jgi:hypothetical protein
LHLLGTADQEQLEATPRQGAAARKEIQR